MTGRATFGGFLTAAHRILTSQPGAPPPTRADVEEVSASLLRVIVILGRYLDDTATAFSDLPRRAPPPMSPWGQARYQASEALAHAARSLHHPGTGGPAWPPPVSASPVARCLDQAATCLSAGRDLLGSHFAPGPAGGRSHDSPWALAITSEPINRALLTEISALAEPIAHHAATVALASIPGAPARTGQGHALNAACQWLWTFAAAIHAAGQQQPVPAADRDVLAAIPVNTLPARPALPAAGTVAGLPAGVIATAERARHLAWHALHQPSWSPAFTVTSWRQIAETATVTSHHCALLATTLAHRAAGTHLWPAAAPLHATAQAARRASRTWYHTAQVLREVTTDTRGHLTPAAAEAHHLATWTGRLAYADPAWTLGHGPRTPARTPDDLAPAPEDLPQVIAAVHHTADAVALLAETQYEQLHHAVRARRILVPTRTLDASYDIPRPYAPAPPERTGQLLTYCRDTARASRHAAVTIGHAAQATHAPSRILTTARAATHPASPVKDTTPTHAPARPDQPEVPGPPHQAIATPGITEPAMVTRGAGLDRAGQQLPAGAAGQLPPAPQQQPPASTPDKAAAALPSHAPATSEPQPAPLPGQTTQPDRNQPALQPEPQA